MAKQPETKTRHRTTDLRAMLKEIIYKELETLPATLAGLPTTHRLNYVCKFMGYVLPKVEAVSYKQGEPFDLDLSIHD